jgi:hypothetical protein
LEVAGRRPLPLDEVSAGWLAARALVRPPLVFVLSVSMRSRNLAIILSFFSNLEITAAVMAIVCLLFVVGWRGGCDTHRG